MKWIILLLVGLLFPFQASAQKCVGCSVSGVRFGQDTTPDRFLLIGDIQIEWFCGRWPGSETECQQAQADRMGKIIQKGLEIGTPDAIFLLGDLTEFGDNDQKDFLRLKLDTFGANIRALVETVPGNHDYNDTNGGDAWNYHTDPFNDAAGALGQQVQPIYWAKRFRHTHVFGFNSPLIMEVTAVELIRQEGLGGVGTLPLCWGDDTAFPARTQAAGDTCTADSDCKSDQCYIGADYYTEHNNWFESRWKLRESNDRDQFALILAHQALCRDAVATCPDTNRSNSIQDMKACSGGIDAGLVCSRDTDCDLTTPGDEAGTCSGAATGYDSRTWLKALLTDSRDTVLWASGHVGASTRINSVSVDYLGTTDFRHIEIPGPGQADIDSNLYTQGAYLTVPHTGAATVQWIDTRDTNSAPVITTSATPSVPANTPTNVDLIATDADYSQLDWTCESGCGACAGGTITFNDDTNGINNPSDVTASLTVDCDAGSYPVTVKVSDEVIADDQTRNLTITVTP